MKLILGWLYSGDTCGLRRESTAACSLVLRFRIPPGAWMFLVSVVFLGRGLCDGPITGSEESYQDVVCQNAVEEPRRGDLGPIGLLIYENRVYRLYRREIRFEGIT
jgi:hypothetical protein